MKKFLLYLLAVLGSHYWSTSSTADYKPYSLNFFCGGDFGEINGNSNNALSIRLVTNVD